MVKRKPKKAIKLGPISETTLGDFSRQAMKTYGSYVIMERAVADARDGLKPVQRRILWATHKLKDPKKFKKSAQIVGKTMGEFHTHGDSSIYQTMVNMVHARYPLVEGHGNFGGPNDPPAAARYTEARLSALAEELFIDIDVATLVPNYSGELQEPVVLPSRLPMLLLNGSMGIGVGLRANIPPHNLKELLKVLVYYISRDNPRMSTVMKHLHGPDYGDGVLLSSLDEIKALYETGKGTLRYRCHYSFEKDKKQNLLVVKGGAPGFNVGNFLTKMLSLRDSGLIDFFSDDSTEKVEIIIGFSDATVVRDRIIPELHTTQSYQFYAVKRAEENEDSTIFSGGLFTMFEEFILFRRNIETLRIQREAKLCRVQMLRYNALLTAISSLDIVYKVLKAKHLSLEDMRKQLALQLKVTDKQAQYILEMKVHRLARMNKEAQEAKIEEASQQLTVLSDDLKDIDGVVVRHLKSLVKYSDARGTVLNVPEPVLKVEEISKYVILQGTKLVRLDKVPSRRHKFDFLCSAKSRITTILSNNEAISSRLSFLGDSTLEYIPVGICNEETLLLCALDDTGKLVTVSPPVNKDNYNIMRGATKLVSAVGVLSNGFLAITTPSGTGRLLPVSELKSTRTFVAGYKLYPTMTHGRKKELATKLYSLANGAELYNKLGRCLTGSGKEYFDAKGPIWCIGEENFVLVKGDKRDLVDRKAAISLLKNGELDKCWIL